MFTILFPTLNMDLVPRPLLTIREGGKCVFAGHDDMSQIIHGQGQTDSQAVPNPHF